jgi:hypothetical protein
MFHSTSARPAPASGGCALFRGGQLGRGESGHSRAQSLLDLLHLDVGLPKISVKILSMIGSIEGKEHTFLASVSAFFWLMTGGGLD